MQMIFASQVSLGFLFVVSFVKFFNIELSLCCVQLCLKICLCTITNYAVIGIPYQLLEWYWYFGALDDI